MKERTLALIKPDVSERDLIAEILILLTEGFKIVDIAMHKLSMDEAKTFYKEHEKQDFYPGLVEYMSSGKTVAIAIEGDGAIKKLRQRIEKEIRPEYGIDETRNAVHGSDSKASATREIKFFFGNIK